ncbi:Gfo/Idh/MocA family protein [Thetidibacter halocola]|uniref:Gfo/Idh/MocA family oxidoreductase n=1 Tax=Thetidibacter halocola TaxID=2827239 RepID=A0A8J8B975_9RHOB|nr:Gfo/Idh/MocA family oxidoreductase [Thetidibacter halocola]MBS0123903.1 Gfo/Idh/MocA family oxidoreductase [Thetidibacter halocola]
MSARIAVVGAGLIGRRHISALRLAEGVTLAAVVDPDPAAQDTAPDVPHFQTLDAMLAAGVADGVILATPNRLHKGGGLACIAAGLPVLVEKPLADTLADARALVEASEAASVALAVGHHRRHNPLIAKAKALIDEGALGRIAAVQGAAILRKPEDYFDLQWRREKGAGPILVNLIHDVDLLAHLCGPIEAVQCLASDAIRGFANEDTAAISLRFASGALGTVSLSDTAVGPWSWELTARENPAYPASPGSCYRIAGTEAALSLPDLTLWRHEGVPGWWNPLSATRFPVEHGDPLVRQADQFGRVITGAEVPLVTGRDGLAAMAVIDAVMRAAESGRTETVTA